MVAVQKARYYFGKDLNLDETYLFYCRGFRIDEQTFLLLLSLRQSQKETQNTFQKAVQFVQSFPTMLVENNGEHTVIEQGYASISDLENVLKY